MIGSFIRFFVFALIFNLSFLPTNVSGDDGEQLIDEDSVPLEMKINNDLMEVVRRIFAPAIRDKRIDPALEFNAYYLLHSLNHHNDGINSAIEAQARVETARFIEAVHHADPNLLLYQLQELDTLAQEIHDKFLGVMRSDSKRLLAYLDKSLKEILGGKTHEYIEFYVDTKGEAWNRAHSVLIGFSGALAVLTPSPDREVEIHRVSQRVASRSREYVGARQNLVHQLERFFLSAQDLLGVLDHPFLEDVAEFITYERYILGEQKRYLHELEVEQARTLDSRSRFVGKGSCRSALGPMASMGGYSH